MNTMKFKCGKCKTELEITQGSYIIGVKCSCEKEIILTTIIPPMPSENKKPLDELSESERDRLPEVF